MSLNDRNIFANKTFISCCGCHNTMDTPTAFPVFAAISGSALTLLIKCLRRRCHAHSLEYSLLCTMPSFVVMCDLHRLLHTLIRQHGTRTTQGYLPAPRRTGVWEIVVEQNNSNATGNISPSAETLKPEKRWNLLLQPLMLGQSDLLAVHLSSYKQTRIQRITVMSPVFV